MIPVTLTVNGRDYPLLVPRTERLLWTLRERLGLTGAKCGCGTNDCGACRVIVDGVARNSCVLLTRNMELSLIHI